MNLHEYQGKEILSKHSVRVQRGYLAHTVEESISSAKKIYNLTNTPCFIIKAQIHAGGRGKGGGIKLAKNMQEVEQYASDILGMNLITPQTSKQGKIVNKVLICEDVYSPGENEIEELYISVLLNRSTSQNMIMYSTEGGMEIEKVAEDHPDKIFTEQVNPEKGLTLEQCKKIATNLNMRDTAFDNMCVFLENLYTAYVESDSSLFEINPVIKASDNQIIAVDAKVTIDENALFRHKDIATYRDEMEEDPAELKASSLGLSYVKLDGNVATVGITDFAQSELGDIVYLEIDSLDTEINSNEVFGTVEAVKTVSDLFMPVNGKVVDVNSSLEDNPEAVNDDPYGEGWIIKIEVSNSSDIDALMNSEEYKNLIGS